MSIFSFRKTRKKDEPTTIFHQDDLPDVKKIQSEVIEVAVHQLKTPLVAMKWSLRTLLDEEAGSLNNAQKSILENCFQSNERVISTIDSILHADRVESKKSMVFNFLNANVGIILENKIYELKENAEQKNIRIKFKANKDLPMASVDAEKIGILFQILIENAITYTNPGGLVKIRIEGNGESLLVSVEDNGIGIPKEKQKNVFTKYFRAPNASRVYVDGSGLGLYIAREIVEKHGGKIWFESEENKGTKFFLTIPIRGFARTKR